VFYVVRIRGMLIITVSSKKSAKANALHFRNLRSSILRRLDDLSASLLMLQYGNFKTKQGRAAPILLLEHYTTAFLSF
jgi:hypothetical protein